MTFSAPVVAVTATSVRPAVLEDVVTVYSNVAFDESAYQSEEETTEEATDGVTEEDEQVQRDPGDTVFFYGGYLFGSWLLTGETRNYNPGTGEFDNIVPGSPLGHGGWGAWELAARVSFVDLTDEDVIGGEQSNITLGLNWYLNERLRMQLNLIKVLDVKRTGSEYDAQDPLIVALRLQWYLP